MAQRQDNRGARRERAVSGRFRIREGVESVIDPDGAVLLDVRHGTYFSLNDVGAEIWQQLQSGASMAELEAHVVQLYDVPPETVRHDVRQFLDGLRHRGLVNADS